MRPATALPIGGGAVGLVIYLLVTLLGGDTSGFDIPGGTGLPGAGGASGQPLPGAPNPDDKSTQFVSFVVGDVQDLWTGQFRGAGRTYERAKLVLFTQAVQSGCGTASSATGPFYCSLDEKAYLDLGFFADLARRFDAPGDFAQAYVIAHEIGHHVQHLLGTSDRVRQLAQQNPGDANELSVRQELQADCYAGVWAHSTYERGLLDDTDLQEGLDAAAAVGDDRIQKQATGRVDQESFTHGTSAQRTSWFRRGFDSGQPDDCDTFSGDV